MVYMYHSFLIHSSADGHLGCFHVLAIINSAAMNIGVHVSLSDLVSLVCMPRSGIARSYGSSISSFFNLHFSDVWWCWASFYVLIGHLYIFFGEVSIQIFHLFEKLACLSFYCSVVRVIYTFLIQELYQVCGLQNFLPSYESCFYLLNGVISSKIF